MEEARKNQIYDRLGKIKMNLDPKNVIDPRYISEKIGQCHVFTEEVESFYLEVAKELSIKQRALMNSETAFEQAKDELMVNDADIISLPSIKDREARANTQLKPDQNEIKSYKIDVVELQGLLGAINLKLRNLDRLNKDIKAQLRLMESQIRLGQGPIDAPTKNLLDAMKEAGADIFQDAKSSSEETAVQDPTVPLDINNLLQNTAALAAESTEPEEESAEEITSEDDILLTSAGEIGVAPQSSGNSIVVDLDTLLNTQKSAGGAKEKEPAVQAVRTVIQTEPIQNMDGLSIDALLKQFS